MMVKLRASGRYQTVLILTILMTLLIISIISFPIMAAEPDENNPPMQNLKKVDGGFFISEENIIKLANYIQDLQDENARLQAMVDRLNNALQEEREAVQLLINEKDNIIALQQEQIEDYKELYQNKDPGIWEKASWVAGGAGIAALIILLSNM